MPDANALHYLFFTFFNATFALNFLFRGQFRLQFQIFDLYHFSNILSASLIAAFLVTITAICIFFVPFSSSTLFFTVNK